MTAPRANFERVRTALIHVVGERSARALLFESLSRWGPQVPATRPEMLSFVRGALRQTLFKRLGDAKALELMLEVEASLSVVHVGDDAPPSPYPSSIPPAPSAVSAGQESSATWTLQPIPPERPVAVVVLSAREDLALVLEQTLGRQLVRCRAHARIRGVAQLFGETPTDLVLVNALDPPDASPIELARLLAHRPSDSAEGEQPPLGPAIWGSQVSFGRELTSALEATGIPCVPIPSGEGITPFLDLVRARQG